MIWTKNYLCNIFFLWLIYLVLTDFALSFSFSRWSLRTLTRNSFLIFHSRETSSWKAWLLWEAAMDTTRQKSNCSRIGHIWHLMMLKVNLTRFVVLFIKSCLGRSRRSGGSGRSGRSWTWLGLQLDLAKRHADNQSHILKLRLPLLGWQRVKKQGFFLKNKIIFRNSNWYKTTRE